MQYNDDNRGVAVFDPSLEFAIAAWLNSKFQRSQSAATQRAYAETLTAFRNALHVIDHDLGGAEALVGSVAQVWASARNPQASRRGAAMVSAATTNKRLSILSSFYKFALRRNLGGITCNPIASLERRSTSQSRHAAVLDSTAVATMLGKIDQRTPAGMRDYALISIAVATGRRAAELANVTIGDLHCAEGIVTITWARTKGGETMQDTLGKKNSAVLLHYAYAVHGRDLTKCAPAAPLWVTYSRNEARNAPAEAAKKKAKQPGTPITTQAIADIFKKHLGVSTVHSTRHSFAKKMDALGASLTTIQRRMGHKNIVTTSRYMHSLPDPINPMADAMDDAFGIGEG